MKRNIVYITYQTFPGRTANSGQTISSLKYFHREGFECTLVYPMRNKSSDKIDEIQSFYSINEEIIINATIHPLPFKKIAIFEKYWYVVSHFLWSYFTVQKYAKTNDERLFLPDQNGYFIFSQKEN